MTMGFSGTYYIKIDDSRRVTVPAAIRKALNGEAFVLYVRPKEKCIRGYTKKDFDEMMSALFSAMENDSSVDNTRIVRHMSMNSMCYEIDKKNRITICKKFLEQTGIGKNVVFCGLGTRFEIMDAGDYDALINDTELSILPF